MRDYATWNVATWRIRAIVEWKGLHKNVIEALDTIQDDRKKTIAMNAWQFSTNINRASGLVIYIQNQINLTDSEVDEIFTEAESIDIDSV
jgi:hypothetical protein